MYSFGTDEYICRVVDTYSAMLLHIAMTRLHTPADAEDVVQEVFLKLLSARPHFRDEAHEKAWLIRATLNRASNLRHSAAYGTAPLEAVPETAAPPEGENQLLSAVRSLPEKYSAVIHLYYYEGYSIKEIARILTLPAPTVGTRLARGREKLRQLLKEDVL